MIEDDWLEAAYEQRYDYEEYDIDDYEEYDFEDYESEESD